MKKVKKVLRELCWGIPLSCRDIFYENVLRERYLSAALSLTILPIVIYVTCVLAIYDGHFFADDV